LAARATIAVMVALLVACPVVHAQSAEAPVEVAAEVEPSEVTVGDVFTLTVTVTAAGDAGLKLPGKDADFGDAEVRSFDTEESLGPEGQRVVKLAYKLALFEVGKREIKAPPITYQGPDGQAKQAPRPVASVTVKSVLPEGAQEIKDIRGPREMPLSPWQWASLIGAALLLVALLAAAFVVWRRLRGKEQEEKAAPPLPAHLEALEALDKLEGEDLVARGLLKDHYVRLSWIIRRYLWRRYRAPALEETTAMLARWLRASGRAPQQAEAFLPVLEEADLVKFAKHQPEDAAAYRALESARQIVNATKPREMPVESEAPLAEVG